MVNICITKILLGITWLLFKKISCF